ncbi:ribosome recycling factor [Candidatus Azambacteria bacterium RIFCSPHIGHO2_02_FULL_52_12]|uniref:Ribosome-recycling factor n=1 Tax=Candidatus Azambacteria bacterium RIFCSPLOWO2_01_FULL_46_25 TaxID=1797298 RepID=A0A1F5BVK4_9BACT|nr:MAG: ribosome recycling factor [Candidatus Azambacteria bacterium RIFCSPHIGHO2_02_FULL_52_12]OGD34618.1 MAG: ribosome recycling factor [Candidatus Azambacteria bacterium RIFCSPLOWO2_01_FULL_46_25]OGD37123.1 MAG: ribosome recycling factor [Candidatus Azambacteria bacterium RIFCSPHIGHO2_01_FULL_51_74]
MEQEVIKKMTEKMEKTVDHFRNETASLRTSRATPSLVDRIQVECYGSMMELNQVASISVASATTLVITPWDKNALEPIARAITQSNLGIAPIADKDTIRLSLPALSQERRDSLIKLLDQYAEDAKIGIRKEREDAIKHIQRQKEDGEIREDDFFKAKNDIQKIVDQFNNEKIQSVRDKKEAEILSN